MTTKQSNDPATIKTIVRIRTGCCWDNKDTSSSIKKEYLPHALLSKEK